jgi:hypothetical protein
MVIAGIAAAAEADARRQQVLEDADDSALQTSS